MTRIVTCIDCGVEMEYGGVGAPPLRCRPCFAQARRAYDKEKKRLGGLHELTGGVPRACEGCGGIIPPYTGKGRPTAFCEPCKRKNRRTVQNAGDRRRRLQRKESAREQG